jgi:hypothetical protein
MVMPEPGEFNTFSRIDGAGVSKIVHFDAGVPSVQIPKELGAVTACR